MFLLKHASKTLISTSAGLTPYFDSLAHGPIIRDFTVAQANYSRFYGSTGQLFEILR